MENALLVNGNQVPAFFYGTAWKEDETEFLTFQALNSGFCALDTANQRKHYYEEGVGRGLQKYLKSFNKKRDSVFVQSKYTYERGQDHRLPYDLEAGFATQVKQSLESSLLHLGVEYLDSLILHGPYWAEGICEQDLEVWEAMENLTREGKVKILGVSNVNLYQLQTLSEKSQIKPKFVQNRCFANLIWDKEIREYCKKNDIVYQGFSLLTANRREIDRPEIADLCEKYSKTSAQIIFRFSVQVGMIPLTGSTNQEHLKQDLAIFDFSLSEEEIKTIEYLSWR